MNKKITLVFVNKTSLLSVLLIVMFSLQSYGQLSLQGTVTNETCFEVSDGSVVLSPTNGVGPYKYGQTVFNDDLSGAITFANYTSTSMTSSATGTELDLTPTSAIDSWNSSFLSTQTFTREAGLTFEGSVFIPYSGYKAVMIGFNDGANNADASVSHGLFLFDNGSASDVSVSGRQGASGGLSMPVSSYANQTATGIWLDFKITLDGTSGATYSIKKDTDPAFTNTVTSNIGNLSTLKIGVQSNNSSGITNTLHKNWRVYKTPTATSNLAPGAYTYYVIDANSSQAQVTVNVAGDTENPVIALNGNASVTINVGDTYNEAGANATDNCSIGSVIISGSVNTAVVASYSVTYNVSDANNNAATTVTRTVNVVDTTVPVITLTGASPQTIEVGAAYSELGATASDNYDGDISGNIVIDATNVNTAVVASYSVTYNVSDANNNAATTVTRTVNVVDTTNPVASVTNTPIVVDLNGNTSITAQDVNSGSSDNYTSVGNLVLSLDQSTFGCVDLGQKTVTLTVTDESNNSDTATITITVQDTVAPANVALINSSYVHQTGTSYVEQGLTYEEACFNQIVIVSSDLDVNQWGTYTISL